MKYFIALFVACAYLSGLGGFSQEKSALPTSLIELLGSPERFDGKVITVRGYLRIGQEPRHGVESILYLHEEDAKHLLGNGVLVIASEKMIRDQEKLNRVYVSLTGTVRITPTAGGWHVAEITDVQDCVQWSNPARPIGDDFKKGK